MKRLLFLAVAAGLVLVAAQAAGARSQKEVYFRLPSKKIACAWVGDTAKPFLRCDVLTGLKPRPKGKCVQGDWAGVSMTKTGKAHVLCISDSVYDNHAPLLAYGATWKHFGFTCTAARSGLTCKNSGGHGFSVSRTSWSVH